MAEVEELAPRAWGSKAGEIAINKVNWPLIALGAIGVLALANLMIYLKKNGS